MKVKVAQPSLFFATPWTIQSMESLHSPAVNTSLLQSPVLWFLWLHCALGTGTGLDYRMTPEGCRPGGQLNHLDRFVLHIFFCTLVFPFCLRCPSHQGLEWVHHNFLMMVSEVPVQNLRVFQSCVHCWVFQICWYTECSILTASYFSILNLSTRILSPLLPLLTASLLGRN